MTEMDWIRIVVLAMFGAFQYWFGYWNAKRKYRVDMEHITAYRKQLREAKAEAWDEGFAEASAMDAVVTVA